MKYLKLLTSDKLSPVKVSVRQAPSIWMRSGKNRQVRRRQILLSRQILDTKGTRKLPPQTWPASHAHSDCRRASLTVTAKAKNECNDGTVRRSG